MKNNKYLITCVITWIILISTISYVYLVSPVKDVPMRRSFVYFPYNIGEWQGQEKPGSDFLAGSLGADDILVRQYQKIDGEKFELYMSYFNHTEKGKGPHAPQLCWVGSGWSFRNVDDKALMLISKGRPKAVVKTIVAKKENEVLLLLYCYKIGSDYSVDMTKFRILSVKDTLFKRTNNAFTLQLTASINEKDIEKKEKEAYKFVTQILSILEEHFFPEQGEKS